MKEVIERYLCDRCLNEIEIRSEEVCHMQCVECPDYPNEDEYEGICGEHVDLCPSCGKEFLLWFRNG